MIKLYTVYIYISTQFYKYIYKEIKLYILLNIFVNKQHSLSVVLCFIASNAIWVLLIHCNALKAQQLPIVANYWIICSLVVGNPFTSSGFYIESIKISV